MNNVNPNQPCFLLGGGPSLSNFDFSKLSNKITIGVNKIFKVFCPNIIYCMDRRFYDYLHLSPEKKVKGDEDLLNQWKRCSSIKVFLESGTSTRKGKTLIFEDDIVVVKRQLQRCISLDMKQGIYSGDNSGFGALMLAICLGFKKIYLLGYDLKIIQNKTHFHNGYLGQSIQTQERHLENFRKTFAFFSDKIKELGIEVINLNPDSALNCFEKRDAKDIL